MPHVLLTRHDRVLVATLSRGKANAIHHELLEELKAALDQAEADDTIGALALVSAARAFFSTGFDVNEVLAYDRPRMTDFFELFLRVACRLARLSKPTLAGIAGHTYAGGAILAAACDFRLFANRPYGFALNEINLGFALPELIVDLVERAAGRVETRRLLLTGAAISPERALAAGLAHDVVPADTFEAATLRFAAELADKPRRAYQEIKASLDRGGTAEIEAAIHQQTAQFIDRWYSAEAEERKRKLIESMKRPAGG